MALIDQGDEPINYNFFGFYSFRLDQIMKFIKFTYSDATRFEELQHAKRQLYRIASKVSWFSYRSEFLNDCLGK
ncbi:hypothetical protein D3C85_1711630 [compost metagenome]